MKKEIEVARSLAELSRDEFRSLLEGYYNIFVGFAKVLEGTGILRKLEEEKEIPILEEDILESLSKLVETEELVKTLEKTDPKELARMVKLLLKAVALVSKLVKIDPRTAPSKTLLELSADLKSTAESLKEIIKLYEKEVL